MALLEVKNAVKHFTTQKAVDGISFQIDRGSIFGLLGPNGAGKTTLLRMITGIIYPDNGEVLLNNKPFSLETESLHIGYMPEERGLYKKMKIGEQAIYLTRLKGLSLNDATKNVKEWFVKFNMESWWDKKVEDLSKGMSQKLQFVTTVAHSPQLIILDEPFSGLDPVNANLLKEEIFDLAKRGHTIIFSTHRMEQVEEICDHIILVNKGKKILDGTIANVKEQFKENIFEINTKQPIAANQLSQIPAEVVDSGSNFFKIKPSGDEQIKQTLQWLLNNNVQLTNFNEQLPTLNDIFIKLVENTNTARQFQTINN